MIRVKKVNNQVVKPVKFITGRGDDKRPIKGADLFSEIYCNTYICARKKSGKSSVLFKIVKECATKETTVIVFASTVDKDRIHIAIKKYCKMANIPYLGYTSMKEDDVDILDTFIHKLQEEAKPKEDSDSEADINESHPLIMFDDSDSEGEKKERKPKYNAPKYLIIFDDLSNELKSTNLTRLLKMNRHWESKIFVSTQYVHDLPIQSIKQCDYALIFRGQPLDKLQKLYRDLDLSIDFELFQQIYHSATQEPYSFLYIDRNNDSFRRNFNYEYDLKNIKQN